MISSTTERPSYQYMDAFRFVAATVVVLGHAKDLLWVDADEVEAGVAGVLKAVYFLTGLGHEAVMVFFVLSGFWIARSVDRRKHDDHFWRPYLVDRCSRLLVVLVPALLIGGILDGYGLMHFDSMHFGGASPAVSVPNDLAGRLSLIAFLGNVAFLQGLAVPTFGSNGPLWSLSYEFWFYIWFPAIVFAVRGRWQIALASLAVGVIWPKVLLGFVIWLMGAGLYYADRSTIASGRPMGRVFATLLLLSCAGALLIALVVARLHIVPLAVSDIAVGGTFAGIVWALLRLDPCFPRIAQIFALYGSRSSFSLYAIHFPLLMFVLGLTGLSDRMQPGVEAMFGLGVLVLLAIAAGWGFSLLTEARTSNVRRWFGTVMSGRATSGR
ncbi:acyltransferase [Croceicoccus ponticola]|uniref:Acyltransferase n=1 Tax=Croceicoccus ponticola TaxID=2217664 RepID=A0A437GZV8_9SPHN|nr:acyltransferase [Croceicoccus ponticola]RVQ68874.1 acyltransferase [Croceicoccus ponticola]